MTHEDIEAVARRVVDLLRKAGAAQLPGRLVDAATVARLLGVSRATVYANADQLGAIRLGKGMRARLRFDATRLVATDVPTDPRSSSDRNARTRRRPAKPSEAERLLPIRTAAPGAKRRRRGAQPSS
jgi:hypothetical protein